MADEDDELDPKDDSFVEDEEDFEGGEFTEEFVEEDFDEEAFGEEEVVGEVLDDEVLDDEVLAVEEEVEETGPRPVRKASDDDDEDDDEVVDPDDIEADLEEILRDRIAAADEDDTDDEEEGDAQSPAERVAGVIAPKRSDEWTCPGCFLIVSATQFGSRANPTCPSGEDPCPSLERLG